MDPHSAAAASGAALKGSHLLQGGPASVGKLRGRGDDEAGAEDEEEEWRKKLQAHDSDGERGGWERDDEGGWGGSDGGGGGSSRGGGGLETENEWADRMWREMLTKRRSKAEAASSKGILTCAGDCPLYPVPCTLFAPWLGACMAREMPKNAAEAL